MRSRLASNSSITNKGILELDENVSNSPKEAHVLSPNVISIGSKTNKSLRKQTSDLYSKPKPSSRINELSSDALSQIYDMIDHTKALRIMCLNKEQDNLLMNIGLPTTKRK